MYCFGYTIVVLLNQIESEQQNIILPSIRKKCDLCLSSIQYQLDLKSKMLKTSKKLCITCFILFALRVNQCNENVDSV